MAADVTQQECNNNKYYISVFIYIYIYIYLFILCWHETKISMMYQKRKNKKSD